MGVRFGAEGDMSGEGAVGFGGVMGGDLVIMVKHDNNSICLET